jgi:oxygen-dependent protoporphyrinogen oxidase
MLERHLGITDTPTVARSRLQKDAVPQYTVGHLDRMYSLSATVRNDFNRRLVLAGNWYNGISVGDCVRSGILASTVGIDRYDLTEADYMRGPWWQFYFRDWDFEGGIPTAGVRIFDFDPSHSQG